MKIVVAMITAPLVLAGVGFADPPSYTVLRTIEPITIDGRNDEAAWGGAPAARLELAPCQEAVPGPGDTKKSIQFKALWDSSHLYFFCRVEEHQVWNCHYEDNYWGYWHEIAFELFFDPDGNGKDFYELQLTPGGNKCDLLNWDRFVNCQSSFTMEGVRLASVVRGSICNDNNPASACNRDVDTGFTIEVAIPFDGFKQKQVICDLDIREYKAGGVYPVDILGNKAAPPLGGDSWRANMFYVSNNLSGGGCPRGEAGTGVKTRKDWAWAPLAFENGTCPWSLHNTDIFGTLVFADSAVGDPPVATEAALSGAHWAGRRITYDGGAASMYGFERAQRCEVTLLSVDGTVIGRGEGVTDGHGNARIPMSFTARDRAAQLYIVRAVAGERSIGALVRPGISLWR